MIGFSVVIDGKEITEQEFSLTRSGDVCEGIYNGVTARQTVTEISGGRLVKLELSGIAPHRCTEFCPIRISGKDVSDKHQYIRYGWTSKYVTVQTGDDLRTPFLALYDKNGQGIFARTVFPLKFRENAELKGLEDGTVLAIRKYLPDSYECDTVASENVFVAEGDMNTALASFASLLPKNPRKPRPVTGYNTWDYYFSDISLEKVKENLDVIGKTPFLKENLQYFTVDDGWQTAWGEWVPNYRFPGGIEKLSETVRSYGLIPGIWTAPLCVNPSSAPAQRSLRGFSPNALGDPKRIEGMYYLDPTHPDTRKAMKELFTWLYKAGIRLFKLDYLSRVLDMQYFYDKTAGPYDALRLLMSDVRECVGEDSIILGCSFPAEAASPDVDCGRTGFDMHNKWGHVTWSMENYQYCWCQQPRLWVNDIDFLLVRGPETDNDDLPRNTLDPGAHEPVHARWRGGDDMTLTEAQTWASCVMLTGGNMILSDRLSVLNEDGMTVIRKALENRSEIPAKPTDQFISDLPAQWVQENKRYVMNWLDTEQTFEVDADTDTYELWSEKMLAPQNGKIRITLPAHASAVLIK